MCVQSANKLLVEIDLVVNQCANLENASFLEFYADFRVSFIYV